MSKRLSVVLSVQGVVVALALLSAAEAQAGWLPPVDISETGAHIGGSQVVLDSGGNATAVWDQWNGVEMMVESAYRPAGEGWQAPLEIAAGDSPQIAGDGDGDITVVWESYAGTNKLLIEAAERPVGEGWQEPVVLGEVKTMADPEPSVGVSKDGDAIVLWHAFAVIKSAFRPAEGTWQAPVDVSDPDLESYVPELAVDANGDATGVWMQEDGPHGSIHSAYRPAGEEWGEPTLVSEPGEHAGDAKVALNANGDTAVVWNGEVEGLRAIRAASRPAGGEWESPASVSTPGNTVVEFPRIALDGDGNAIVAWADTTDESSNYALVTVSYRPADGKWGSPEGLSEEGGDGYPLDLVFDTSGNVAVAWERDNGEDNVVQAAYRPAEGDWEEPTNLSEPGTDAMDASLVLDAPGDETAADGDATAIWTKVGNTPCGEKSSCSGYTVQAAGYDPNGPPAVEIEVPDTGTAGEPVEISSPTEEIFAPLIEFGDGESVADTEASHVYEEPGEYEVKFGGAEVLGYRASVQRTITILSAEGPSPKPEPESGGPGPGTPDPKETPVVPPGTDPRLADSHPSAQCVAAESARDSALRRLRRIGAKLSRAQDASQVRRLSEARHEQAVALRRARRRVATDC